MNYSLSSSRKIGNYIQKIITTQNNTAKATSTAVFDSLRLWHTVFANLDASDREVGTIEYKGFTETPSANSSNIGTTADITFTVLSTSILKPKTTTLKVNNVTLDNFATALNTAFNTLTGFEINISTNYLISAILNLH